MEDIKFTHDEEQTIAFLDLKKIHHTDNRDIKNKNPQETHTHRPVSFMDIWTFHNTQTIRRRNIIWTSNNNNRPRGQSIIK